MPIASRPTFHQTAPTLQARQKTTADPRTDQNTLETDDNDDHSTFPSDRYPPLQHGQLGRLDSDREFFPYLLSNASRADCHSITQATMRHMQPHGQTFA